MGDQPKRRCIVSRDWLRSGALIAELQASFRPEDDVQIIVDRRHAGFSGEPYLKENRRRHRQVDRELETKGFALVPASNEPTENTASSSPLFPDSAVEQSSLEEDDEDDNKWFRSIRSFRRQWSDTMIPELIGVVSGVTLAALVLSLAGQLLGLNLISAIFTGPVYSGQPPSQTNERFTSAQLLAVTERRAETPSRAPSTNESSLAGDPASTKSVSPSSDSLASPQHETSGASKRTDLEARDPSTASGETGALPKETGNSVRSANTPADEAGAPAEAGRGGRSDRTRPAPTDRPNPSVSTSPNQVVSAPLPAPTSKTTPYSARAELVRGPVARGWGDSYAVRLLDPAGRPMVALEVILVARMADGTVENIAMGALPERGTYRATVPTGRSTPVDLRVRASTGEKFVEMPVRR